MIEIAFEDLRRITIGVDPAVTSGEDSDDTGLVVVGRGPCQPETCKLDKSICTGHGYVLADLTCHVAPREWARRAVAAYYEWDAGRIVAEVNNGGDMVGETIHAIDPGVPYRQVRASRGKQTRAEPASALFDQGRCHMLGVFSELEEQMCVAGDTLITTSDGDVPIRDVHAGDRVLTRQGWRPVLWSGQTGYANCMAIEAADRVLRLTPEHPVWIEGVGFTPAREVQSYMECLYLSRANTSSITGSSTSVLGMATRSIGDQRGSRHTAVSRCSCIECSTARHSAPSQTEPRFITGMRMASITRLATSSPLLGASITQSTIHAGGGHGLRAHLARDGERSGQLASLARSSAGGAGASSSVQGSVLRSVRRRAIDGTTEPVYNLTVAEVPEFFANGILVHNCTWTIDAKWSPDRLDALVWALVDLGLIGAQGAAFMTAWTSELDRRRATAHIPKGPQGLPRLGNVIDIPVCKCRPGVRRFFQGRCTVCQGVKPEPVKESV